MRYERTLEAWTRMYPEEMADMLKPLNSYFNTLLSPQVFDNNYKIFWDYLITTQWNRVVLNPMHYSEPEDIAEINLMTERVRNQLISNMDALENKHAYLNKLRETPFFISNNYDITKVGTEVVSNHSFTSKDISEDSTASNENKVKMTQDKKETKSSGHTYDNNKVDTEESQEYYTHYEASEGITAKPSVETENNYNTKSITTHSRDGLREYGMKNGKTFAENYKDNLDAMSYNYIEDICKVIMKGFMYYIYA